MKTDIVPERLDDLVFACIAGARRPPAHAEVVQKTRAFAPSSYDDATWSAAIADATARLVASGTLAADRRVADGLSASAARLGARAPRTWQQLSSKLLPALALGVTADDERALQRLDGRDAWAAAIIARARGLWTDGGPPKLAGTCDALIWHGLGLPGRPGRVPPVMRAHFLALELATSPAAATRYERRAAQLAASLVGAPRTDLAALRAALVRRWLTGQGWPSTTTATPRASAPSTAAAARPVLASASDFAAAVRLAAERTTDGVFGTRKVFISSVWRDPAFRGVSLAEFKQRLLDAHRSGAIVLARADLVGAMDPELVRESETAHHESRYHFIERGGTP